LLPVAAAFIQSDGGRIVQMSVPEFAAAQFAGCAPEYSRNATDVPALDSIASSFALRVASLY
jgi:hypothetical protein